MLIPSSIYYVYVEIYEIPISNIVNCGRSNDKIRERVQINNIFMEHTSYHYFYTSLALHA